MNLDYHSLYKSNLTSFHKSVENSCDLDKKSESDSDVLPQVYVGTQAEPIERIVRNG